MNERTIRVSKSRPMPMVLADLCEGHQGGQAEGEHGEGEDQPGGGDDGAGAGHGSDDAGFDSGMDLFLNRDTSSRL